MYNPSDHTFVVCAYGESPYLESCVQSLLAQTVRTNIIMATSTPNKLIERVAAAYQIPLHVSGNKPGICSDWNYAVSCASTPLVTIAHQDDTYEPAYAATALQMMGAVERPLIFFTNYGELRDGQVVDDNRLLRIKRLLLRPIARRGSTSSKRIKRRIISIGSAICCPSVTLNMAVLPSPPFVSTMKSNLDWETWERFSHLDGAFVYSTKILMHHRIHEGSETSNLIKDNTRTVEDLAMLEKFWPKPIARLLNMVYSSGQKSNG